MGTMIFDAGILPNRMDVNLATLTGRVYDEDVASWIVDSAIDYEAEDLWETGCRNCEVSPSLDFDEFFQRGAELLPELLQLEFPDLFGDDIAGEKGAITIESVGKAYPNRGIAPATIAIDKGKLSQLAEKHGILELWDGHGTSGFVRTVGDAYWAVCQAVPALMDQLSDDQEKFWLVDPLHETAIDLLSDNANEELAEENECPVHSVNGIPWAWGR